MKRLLSLAAGVAFCGLLLSLGVTQEVPMGNVRGKVVMQENGRPLAGALVTLSRFGAPDDERLKPRFAETREDGTFDIRGVPAELYEVEVASKNHELPKTIVTVPEGAPTELKLSLNRGADRLSLYASQRVFTPDENPQIELHGFIVPDTVQIDVRKVDVGEVADKGGLQQTLSPLASANAPRAKEIERIAPLLRRIDHRLTKKDAEGAFIETLPVGDLKEGFYWVTVRAGQLTAQTALSVSRIALITKHTGRDALVYATDIVSGKPLAGVEVSAQGASGLVSIGRTGRDGTLIGTLPKIQKDGATLVARRGTSVAIVSFWTGGEEQRDVRIVGYTDRPVYRPGDTLKFKGIIRRLRGQEMRPPESTPVDVELRDPDDTIMSTLRLQSSAHGSFNGEFTTSPEAKPGYYRIVCRALGASLDSLTATIAAYRKPEYRVTVRPEGGPFTLGQKASVLVDCQYYFGGPVAGAKVKASVYRTVAWKYEDEEGESYEEDYGAGEYSQEVEGTTDAAGRVVLDFETRTEDDPEQFENDYFYTVVASVADEAGKYFDGEGKVKVTRGKVDLAVDVGRYVASPGESVDVTIKLTNANDPKEPVAGQDVTLEVGEWRWTRRTSVTVPRSVQEGRTDADGIAKFKVPFSAGGDFVLRGRTKDTDGRTVTGRTSLWVEGGTGESAKPEADLTIRLDRRSYRPGETARILIETDAPGGSALLTVQAEGILSRQVVPLTSGSTLVRIPVRVEHAPNVYIAAAYVHDKQFREDTKRLTVDRAERGINVAVTPDRKDYQPGETARLTVRTTDASGKPVPAELSVGVVDESIYAIQEDRTNLREMLNPRRADRVQTNHSFPEVYLDGGDKGAANIPLRKKFEDTAAWMPDVWTGSTGEATVEVKLPDNLTEWRTTAIGVTDGGSAGQVTAKFRARKPLMVRLSPPAYLVQGDRQQVAISVTNDTGQDAEVNLELGVQGLVAEGERNPKLRIRAGATEAALLELKAGNPGEAVLTARAWIGAGVTDGVEQRFAIVPHGREQVDAVADRAAPLLEMAFDLKASAAPKMGGLTLSVTPSLAGGVVQALDGLVDYPYGCVEQTMSRFMPAVVVADALKKLNLERPALAEKIPKVAADSMARLARMQHGDGGWGWWEYDENDVFMTALVLDGLDRARRAGYEPKGINLENALTWATGRFAKPERDDRRRDRLYLAYALLRHGRAVEGLDKIDLAKASGTELATAALAFHEAGTTARRDEVLRRLRASATGGNIQARWASDESSWGEEPNAIALTAFATIRPNDPIIPRIVRGIMARRKGNDWTSTRDTSYSIIGLVATFAHEAPGGTTGIASIRINGREIRQVMLDPRKPEGETITVPREELPTGALKVEVERLGEGSCYASALLRQFVVEKDIAAVSTDAGLQVRREYFVMEARRLEDGSTKLLPSVRPVTQVQPGELVRVVLTIHADTAREYVMIEDPTPSNCRVTEREDIGEGEEWGWWWSRNVIRDDRIAIFARWLPKGKSVTTYTMRAEGIGLGSALPTRVGPMYDPSQWASTGETRLEVAR